MTPADLRLLHKYILEIDKVSAISDEMREVIEDEWPELMHKLPRQSRGDRILHPLRKHPARYPRNARIWSTSSTTLPRSCSFSASSRSSRL
jgi:hypothetical protein